MPEIVRFGMEKFNRTLRGYDPVEVNQFLDQVIKKVENMVAELNKKNEEIRLRDERIKELESLKSSNANADEVLKQENEKLKEKLEQYRRTEDTLNKAIIMAQKTSDQMRMAAHKESETIIDNAKKNANRIVNEALLRAEKTEDEVATLRRNIHTFKRRLKTIVEAQLEVIDEIDEIEL